MLHHRNIRHTPLRDKFFYNLLFINCFFSHSVLGFLCVMSYGISAITQNEESAFYDRQSPWLYAIIDASRCL